MGPRYAPAKTLIRIRRYSASILSAAISGFAAGGAKKLNIYLKFGCFLLLNYNIVV